VILGATAQEEAAQARPGSIEGPGLRSADGADPELVVAVIAVTIPSKLPMVTRGIAPGLLLP